MSVSPCLTWASTVSRSIRLHSPTFIGSCTTSISQPSSARRMPKRLCSGPVTRATLYTSLSKINLMFASQRCQSCSSGPERRSRSAGCLVKYSEHICCRTNRKWASENLKLPARQNYLYASSNSAIFIAMESSSSFGLTLTACRNRATAFSILSRPSETPASSVTDAIMVPNT